MALIISLTTIKSRIDLAYLVVYSLLKQEVKPDKIYVWISKEKYLLDDGISSVPDWYEHTDNRIVKIRWTPNIGPYRKLSPLYLEMTNDDIVVTVDDDMYFGPLWLKRIMETSMKYPEHVIAGIARVPTRNFLGGYQNYAAWPICRNAVGAFDIIPIGAGGILYKKHFFDSQIMCANSYITDFPVTDDIWYRYATATNSILVTIQNGISEQVYKIDTPDSLWNNINSGNKGSQSHKLNLFEKAAKTISNKVSLYFGITKGTNDYAFSLILSSVFQKCKNNLRTTLNNSK